MQDSQSWLDLIIAICADKNDYISGPGEKVWLHACFDFCLKSCMHTGFYDKVKLNYKTVLRTTFLVQTLDWRERVVLQHAKSLFSKEASATLLNMCYAHFWVHRRGGSFSFSLSLLPNQLSDWINILGHWCDCSQHKWHGTFEPWFLPEKQFVSFMESHWGNDIVCNRSKG